MVALDPTGMKDCLEKRLKRIDTEIEFVKQIVTHPIFLNREGVPRQ